jgi:Pentapeptide repeats (8 copies)
MTDFNQHIGADPIAADREAIRKDLAKLNEAARRASNRGMTFAECRDEYRCAAQVLFTGRDLRSINLANADLKKLDFRGSDMSGCDFSNAKITGADFQFAKVSRDELRRAVDWDEHVRQHVPRQPTGGHNLHPWARFSLAPYLPELVALPATLSELTVERTGNSIADLGLSERELEAAAKGQLAIALRPLDTLEFKAIADDDNDRSPPWGQLAAVTVSGASHYFGQLRRHFADAIPPNPSYADADLQDFSAGFPSVGLLKLLRQLAISDPVAPRWHFELRTDMRPADLSIVRENGTAESLGEYALTETGRMATFRYANRTFKKRNQPTVGAVAGSGDIDFDGRAHLRPVFFFDARGWTRD